MYCFAETQSNLNISHNFPNAYVFEVLLEVDTTLLRSNITHTSCDQLGCSQNYAAPQGLLEGSLQGFVCTI